MADRFRNSRNTYSLRQQRENYAHHRHWIKNPLQIGFQDSKKPDGRRVAPKCTFWFFKCEFKHELNSMTAIMMYDCTNHMRRVRRCNLDNHDPWSKSHHPNPTGHVDKKHKNKKAGYEHMDNCPMITMFDISTPIKRFTTNTSTIWLKPKRTWTRMSLIPQKRKFIFLTN